jgi:hypothetical protein
MRSIVSIVMALAVTTAVSAPAAMAASGDTKAKKEACQERAKTMNFGIHLIRKHRWVNDCIAGKHPA